jgi:hypothetical protein
MRKDIKLKVLKVFKDHFKRKKSKKLKNVYISFDDKNFRNCFPLDYNFWNLSEYF